MCKSTISASSLHVVVTGSLAFIVVVACNSEIKDAGGSDASERDSSTHDASSDGNGLRDAPRLDSAHGDAHTDGGTTATCGNGRCESGESRVSCSADCGFVHPGVAMNRQQLDFVKAKIAAMEEPWFSAFTEMRGRSGSSLSFTPNPAPHVKSGSIAQREGMEEVGWPELERDYNAAYNQALLWYYTEDRRHAQKAIEILNAWSNTLERIWFDEVRSDDNQIAYNRGKLIAGWAGETIVRAAEIMRHTYTAEDGEVPFDVAQFETMLNEIFLPLTENGWTGGGVNWLFSMADATMAIGVFTNNEAVFNNGLGDYRRQMPAAIYMESDSTAAYENLAGRPLPPPESFMDKPNVEAEVIDNYWRNPTTYISGIEGETCRDLSHATMGFEGMAYAAETARIQGVDLYGEFEERFTTSIELNAAFINAFVAGGEHPDWPCGEPLNEGGNGYTFGWEVAYNHYANRRGLSLPEVAKLADANRPTDSALHMNWETLTHYGTP